MKQILKKNDTPVIGDPECVLVMGGSRNCRGSHRIQEQTFLT